MMEKPVTLEELMKMTGAELDLSAYHTTEFDQLQVMDAYEADLCFPACAGALDPLGDCDCQCQGQFHGRLWIRNIHFKAEISGRGRPSP